MFKFTNITMQHVFACTRVVCLAAVLAACWCVSATWLESVVKDLEVKIEAQKPQPSLLESIYEPFVQWMWPASPPPPLPEVWEPPFFSRHVTAVLKIMRLQKELRESVPTSAWVFSEDLMGSVIVASLVVVLIVCRARGQGGRPSDPNGASS